MSEARRNQSQPSPVQVVEPASGSVTDRLSMWSKMHVVYVRSGDAKLPIPMAVKYEPGHVCNAREARALNSTFSDYAGNKCISAFAGDLKDADDTARVEYATKQLNGDYSFTSDVGSAFADSMLTIAADRVVFDLGVKQGHLSGSYDDHSSAKERDERSGVVQQILTDDSLGEKYAPVIEAMIRTMLAERPAVQKREAKKTPKTSAIQL